MTHYPQDELRSEIRKRDWERVHLSGDRNPPLSFAPARQWIAKRFHLCRGEAQ